MKNALRIAALVTACYASPAFAVTCTGSVENVQQWSDQTDTINFTLSTGITIQTTKKEQGAMALTAFATGKNIVAYWSCSSPPNCQNQNSIVPICGYIQIQNNL